MLPHNLENKRLDSHYIEIKKWGKISIQCAVLYPQKIINFPINNYYVTKYVFKVYGSQKYMGFNGSPCEPLMS